VMYFIAGNYRKFVNQANFIILFLVEVFRQSDGEGISKENLSKITDPFFTTKEPGKGAGLGLSIVYQIIEEQKGTIEFKSKIGKGTKVIIKLPNN